MSTDYSYQGTSAYDFGILAGREALKKNFNLPRNTIRFEERSGEVYSPLITPGSVEVYIKGKKYPECTLIMGNGRMVLGYKNTLGESKTEVFPATDTRGVLNAIAHMNMVGRSDNMSDLVIAAAAFGELIPAL